MLFLASKWVHAVVQLVEGECYKYEGRGFECRWCHWNFSMTQSFWPHYGPGVDSASNRNEYQEYFLGGRGSLKILEPLGPVQACVEIVLPLRVASKLCAIDHILKIIS